MNADRFDYLLGKSGEFDPDRGELLRVREYFLVRSIRSSSRSGYCYYWKRLHTVYRWLACVTFHANPINILGNKETDA